MDHVLHPSDFLLDEPNLFPAETLHFADVTASGAMRAKTFGSSSMEGPHPEQPGVVSLAVLPMP